MKCMAITKLSEMRRVKFFRRSVRGHHQITQTLTTFDQTNRNPRQHTYDGTSKWVLAQLPPILSMAGLAAANQSALAVTGRTPTPNQASMTHEQLQGAYVALPRG